MGRAIATRNIGERAKRNSGCSTRARGRVRGNKRGEEKKMDEKGDERRKK